MQIRETNLLKWSSYLNNFNESFVYNTLVLRTCNILCAGMLDMDHAFLLKFSLLIKQMTFYELIVDDLLWRPESVGVVLPS